MTSCGEVIAETLQRMGTRHFFLFTGGDHALFVGLKKAGIEHVLARSEHAAVYMADAYARVTGQATVVYGQYGPGAANIAGSLAEPFWSSSPVIALASSMRRQHRGRFEYQELDQTSLFSPVTKWQTDILVPDQAERMLRAAENSAIGGNPGPVYLGLANDLTAAEAPDDVLGDVRPDPAAPRSVPLFRPQPSDEDVRRSLDVLAQARRPLILAGNGVHLSRGHLPLRDAVERLGIGVVTSLSGKGAIEETHALSLGTVGRYSREYANSCVAEADALLVIGSRLGGLVTDSYKLVSRDCRLVHVDCDPMAIGHNFPAEVGVQSDAASFLTMLCEALPRRTDLGAYEDERGKWLAAAQQRREDWTERYRAIAASAGGDTMRPEAAISVLERHLSEDTLILADTGYMAAWAGALYRTKAPGRTFLRSDGSLGWAMPAALGAKLADPGRPVVSIVGDGGFGYHVGELETAVRLGLPVVWLVMNNRSLAFEYHIQDLMYGQAVAEADDFHDVDYASVARQFGADGRRVHSPEQLADAIGRAVTSDRPVVLDVLIDKEAIAPVTRYDSIRRRDL